MIRRGVLVVGVGRRVVEDALPALYALEDVFEVRGACARTTRDLEVAGRKVRVTALDELRTDNLEAIDLVYLAVPKGAVPDVLRQLAALCAKGAGARGTDLLIETPVVLFKHFHHLRRLDSFRRTWVAEDCSRLPSFDPVHALVHNGRLGALQRVEFHHAAFKYHGLAMLKTLLGCDRIRSAKQRRTAEGAVRELRFANGGSGCVIEPRDYSKGHVVLRFEGGVVSDEKTVADSGLLLEAVTDGALGAECRGFRIGETSTPLRAAEIDLVKGTPDGVTARMEGLKRVGLLRLFEAIAAGEGAYPLTEALDDMAVDYLIDKVGRWRSSPFTSVRSGVFRCGLRTLTRLAGR